MDSPDGLSVPKGRRPFSVVDPTWGHRYRSQVLRQRDPSRLTIPTPVDCVRPFGLRERILKLWTCLRDSDRSNLVTVYLRAQNLTSRESTAPGTDRSRQTIVKEIRGLGGIRGRLLQDKTNPSVSTKPS